ncbi:MAG: hypothetical protein DRQ42_05820 [Gammaproteobacteria bacterium]|nr:MAG: hypothetical protein DRQ42_05820 [Gammaproteobacteria bacterium]
MRNLLCGIFPKEEPLEISDEMSQLPSGDSIPLTSDAEPKEGLVEGTSETRGIRTERRAYNNQW